MHVSRRIVRRCVDGLAGDTIHCYGSIVTTTDRIDTRVSRLLGVRYPIVQAPMGWIARAQLASAVSNAGGPRHHRDVVRRARRREGRDPEDARPHRPARSA
jgi:hypothetical protein